MINKESSKFNPFQGYKALNTPLYAPDFIRSYSQLTASRLLMQLNNPDFKGVEFDSFLFEAGSNTFTLSPKCRIDSSGIVPIGKIGSAQENSDHPNEIVGEQQANKEAEMTGFIP